MSKTKVLDLSFAGLRSLVCIKILQYMSLAAVLVGWALAVQPTQASQPPIAQASQPSTAQASQPSTAQASQPSIAQASKPSIARSAAKSSSLRRQTANTPSPQNPGETSANLSQFKSEFLQVTGLRKGHYERRSGPDTCQEGELRLVEVDSSLSVLLGAHALVTGLGRGSFESQDDDCLSQVEASFSQGQFGGTRKEHCQGERPLSIEVKVEVLPQGQLRYQRTNRQGRKVIFKENCLLQLAGS